MGSATLGIDLGIASIGFALIDNQDRTIMELGVHVFERAENPKDGASLALPRRLARGRRRLMRRRRSRLAQVAALLTGAGFSGVRDTLDALTGRTQAANPWQLRRDGLTRLLDDGEFARVLHHIAKHRGFQSNRKEKIELAMAGADKKSKDKDKEKAEKQKMLASLEVLKGGFGASGRETVGAYLAEQSKQRNNPAQYERTVPRDLLRDEVRVLFERQRGFGQAKATQALLEEYLNAAFTQRPILSSYWMVGECELEDGEKRAPKNSFTAERFIALSRLRNLKILTMGKALGRELTEAERRKLMALALEQKSGVTFNRARKELGLGEEERFNLAVYRKTEKEDTWEKIRKKAEDRTLIAMKGYHAVKEAVEPLSHELWVELEKEPARLDAIARAFSFFNEDVEIIEELKPARLPVEIEKALLERLDFSGTIGLSLKALYNIIPHMENGEDYATACASAGYHHSKKAAGELLTLPPIPSTRNPVVDRALSQARKVINHIIRRNNNGIPDRIHVEFSRDLGKPREERDAIQRENNKFAELRESLKKHAAEEVFLKEKDSLSGEEFMKYRLWKDQGCFCLYSGEEIKPHHLIDPLACQIDHALPRSRSWDNSYSNKVLCFTGENQRKGNLTPYEYLSREGRQERWRGYEEYVKTLSIGLAKKRKLLMKDFDEKAGEEFKERNLNDTRYMARKLKSHIEENLAPKEAGTQFVMTVNGQMTALLRGAWGLAKSREDDLHHAADAAVIACATPAMVNAVNEWSRYGGDGRKRKGVEIDKPWPTFREDLIDAMQKVFVSRQPDRKGRGQGHDETILSGRTEGEKTYYVKRMALSDLSSDKLANIVDVELIDGQPTGRNRRLYEVLKERLDAFGGVAKKAFVEPIHMPVNDPDRKGPQIRSVRVRTNDKSVLPVRGGYAGNASMVRVDVFRKGGKYCLVPVYAHHVAKKELADRVCKSNTAMDEWGKLDDGHQFTMSWHKNDYLVVDQGKRVVEGYYVGLNIHTGSITLKPHHGQKDGDIEGVGVATAKSITKYVVNVFGEKFKVKKEKRHGVADSPRRE